MHEETRIILQLLCRYIENKAGAQIVKEIGSRTAVAHGSQSQPYLCSCHVMVLHMRGSQPVL